jgi:hypothetical protein
MGSKEENIVECSQILNVYKSKGHTVEEVEFSQVNDNIHTILADNEFEMLREEIEERGIKVNISAKKEHVRKWRDRYA